MFERYTETARRTIFFARYEASQFGSPCIEAEHLLLGLIREDRDLFRRLFTNLPASQSAPLAQEVLNLEERIRTTIKRMEKAIGKHDFEEARRCSEQERSDREALLELRQKYNLAEPSDFETPLEAKLGELRRKVEQRAVRHDAKIATSKDLPLSHESKKVLAYGAEESERMNHGHIGPEHLLLGMLREEKSLAAAVLVESGLSLDAVRQQIASSGPRPERHSMPAPPPPGLGPGRLMEALLGREHPRVVLLARHEALHCGAPCIETVHVLLALAYEKDLEGLLPAPVQTLREWIMQAAGPARERVDLRSLALSEPAQRVFVSASEEAARAGQPTGPRHVLLGLLREPNAATEILEAHGFNAAEVRAKLTQPPPASDPQPGRDYV